MFNRGESMKASKIAFINHKINSNLKIGSYFMRIFKRTIP